MFLTDSISMGGDWDTIWRLTAPTSYLIPVMCAVHIGAFFGRAGVGGRGVLQTIFKCKDRSFVNGTQMH